MEMCEENGRWQFLPWVYLTYAERNAWGELGWSEQWWDRAWEANSAAVSATGRCFGGKYLIGETGLDRCLVGELVNSYEVCENASGEYQLAFPGDLFELGAPVDDLQGTPGCHTQDRVGFQFNTAQITGRNFGYSPICEFDPDMFGGGCPQTTTSTTSPLPDGVEEMAIPEAATKCYQDLTPDQQDAVRLLGYSISAWHSCMRADWDPPVCEWPEDIPDAEATCLEHLDYLEAKYDTSKPWAEVTSRAKEAFVELGWDSEGIDWANMDYPDTYAKPFSGQPAPTGLSVKEQQAAEFLGYVQSTWHRCEVESECLIRFSRIEEKMMLWKWREMPSGPRRRLEELGWHEESWFEGQPPATYRYSWEELRFPERVAAQILGFSRDTWEGCQMSPCVDRYNYVNDKYKTKQWSDMNLAQQNAWLLLEHSPELWAAGGMMRTRLFSSRWEELSPEQQRQAMFLGHSEGTWQGCNLDWESSDSNITSEPVISGGPIRTVRAEMTIDSPFGEITGNIYGQQVVGLPTSFVEVFQRAVGRALFCGNPDYKSYPDGARDEDGNALCLLPLEFERQKQRIRVVNVREGSIIVDFIIVRNQTVSEDTAEFLYKALARQLESHLSPLGQDIEFGKYARLATIEEVPLSTLSPDERDRALEFEKTRSQFDDTTACNLKADARNGVIKCPVSAALPSSGRSPLLGLGLPLLFALIALVGSSSLPFLHSS